MQTHANKLEYAKAVLGNAHVFGRFRPQATPFLTRVRRNPKVKPQTKGVTQ